MYIYIYLYIYTYMYIYTGRLLSASFKEARKAASAASGCPAHLHRERDFLMIWWTGLAPWEFELPLPGSLTSTFLDRNRIKISPLLSDEGTI